MSLDSVHDNALAIGHEKEKEILWIDFPVLSLFQYIELSCGLLQRDIDINRYTLCFFLKSPQTDFPQCS